MPSSETMNNKTVYSTPLKRQETVEMLILNHELQQPRMCDPPSSETENWETIFYLLDLTPYLHSVGRVLLGVWFTTVPAHK